MSRYFWHPARAIAPRKRSGSRWKKSRKESKKNIEPSTKLHSLLHTKQYSLYSLFQHLLLSISPLAYFLFMGFLESYSFILHMLARIVLILYIIAMLITYLITKKRDFLYMIIAFVIEFPIIVFLAYFDQMVALLTLSFLGFLPWIQVIRNPSPSSPLKVSKKITLKNKSQDKFSIEDNS